MTKAEDDVLAERAKQRAKWGDDHDDEQHPDEELADAAAYLASSAGGVWAPRWAISLEVRHDRRQQLVIAAALLLAEIDRIDRLAGVTP